MNVAQKIEIITQAANASYEGDFAEAVAVITEFFEEDSAALSKLLEEVNSHWEEIGLRIDKSRFGSKFFIFERPLDLSLYPLAQNVLSCVLEDGKRGRYELPAQINPKNEKLLEAKAEISKQARLALGDVKLHEGFSIISLQGRTLSISESELRYARRLLIEKLKRDIQQVQATLGNTVAHIDKTAGVLTRRSGELKTLERVIVAMANITHALTLDELITIAKLPPSKDTIKLAIDAGLIEDRKAGNTSTYALTIHGQDRFRQIAQRHSSPFQMLQSWQPKKMPMGRKTREPTAESVHNSLCDSKEETISEMKRRIRAKMRAQRRSNDAFAQPISTTHSPEPGLHEVRSRLAIKHSGESAPAKLLLAFAPDYASNGLTAEQILRVSGCDSSMIGSMLSTNFLRVFERNGKQNFCLTEFGRTLLETVTCRISGQKENPTHDNCEPVLTGREKRIRANKFREYAA